MSAKMDVVIVGGGIGGLAAAISLALFAPSTKPCVAVLEAASQFSEIGAGIQIAPNFTRLLYKLGLGRALEHKGVVPRFVRQVRWANGAELTRFALNENDRFERDFGFKYFYLHRADLHAMLLDRACELGVDVLLDMDVVEYRPRGESSQNPERKDLLICRNGRSFEADLIIAADGAKSKMCHSITGGVVPATPTGDSAYRAMLTREQVSDPAFEGLHLENGSVVWLGPDRHVVGYFVSGMRLYNMVILVPDDEVDEETWKLKGNPQKLQAHFHGWDWRLQKLVSLVKTPYLWNLRDRPMLDSWLHPTGNMVLLGDSAHPMLPYVGQGAASAVEDAVVLAECLEFASRHTWTIRQALKVYQDVRRPRTLAMREAGRSNKTYFHLPDGKCTFTTYWKRFADSLRHSAVGREQEERDAALACEGRTGKTPNQLNDPTVLQNMYNFDVLDQVRQELHAIEASGRRRN